MVQVGLSFVALPSLALYPYAALEDCQSWRRIFNLWIETRTL